MGSRTIGVISDTHGLLRPEARDALQGTALILHAGDVGGVEVLDALRDLAPVIAVRGNVDRGEWASALPERHTFSWGPVRACMVHDRADLVATPPDPDVKLVVFGHSHKPLVERRDGVLWLNPGSAGPRRFRLPISLARLHVSSADLDAELVTLG